MADPRLPHLFSPFRAGSLELKNRVVMAPMGNRYPSYYYKVTDRMRRYYLERARGGAGLIIVQFTCVSPEGRGSLYLTGLWDDQYIPGMQDLVADIHRGGAKAAIQLAHAGSSARSAFAGTSPVAPSPIPLRGGETPRELFIHEVEALVESFAQAARRARDAGFDAVQFHAAHGYLLNQFLSPLWNRREDRYGGSTEKRTRFLVEIIERTRQLVGEGYPIMVRLCADEFLPGGIDLEEGCSIARILSERGVDILDVTGGIGETTLQSVPNSAVPPGTLVPLAAAVREATGKPVIAVGKLHLPEVAESVLAHGKADLIALGRALLADPFWPAKAEAGHWEDIRPCLACGAPDCHGRTIRQLDLGCVVNPTVGREDLFPSVRTDNPKRVMVVGGGAAGMEAAKAASLRGHHVTLHERGEQLGGQIPLAAAPPHKEEMSRYLTYMRHSTAVSPVQVVLNSDVTVETVEREQPDVVVLASGSQPVAPPIPVLGSHVATSWDVLSGAVETGRRLLIVGGGDVGCETAEYLVARGRQVTIVEMMPEVAAELIWWNREAMVKRLVEAEVEILTNSRVLAVHGREVSYVRSGISHQICDVDTVVFASGVRPESALGEVLRVRGFDVREAGDAARPGNLASAVRGGFEAGATIE